MLNEPLVKQIYIDDTEHTVDWLMYRSYEFNRLRSPEIAPERWRALYLNQETYEKIFQGEQS
jgi:hypothetical protein